MSRRVAVVTMALFLHAAVRAADAAPALPAAAAQPVFAIVAGTVIGVPEYERVWAEAQRQKFYHRKAPESEVNQLRREVGDRLINRVLLAAEVERRAIEPDRAKVDATLAGYEQRYRDSPQWARMRDRMLPGLRAELERQSRLERLEAQVRDVPAPPVETVRAYYERHPELFTEPEQVRLSLILLKVDPSAPAQVRQKAREEAAAIRARIARGADFAELARLHSADSSAANGGDMGYLHRGMLPDGIVQEVDKLAPLAVSDPIAVLEGVALIRFDDRRAAKLREFDAVRERAAQLWLRAESERRWSEYLAGLRMRSEVTVVDASRYPATASADAR